MAHRATTMRRVLQAPGFRLGNSRSGGGGGELIKPSATIVVRVPSLGWVLEKFEDLHGEKWAIGARTQTWPLSFPKKS